MDLIYASVTARHRPFFEKLESVAAAGFTGIAASTMDYQSAIDAGHSASTIVDKAKASGVDVASVGGVTAWLTGEVDAGEAQSFELATAFGSTMLNCTPTGAPFVGLDEAVVAFAGVCDRAAAKGLRCRLEFVPWTGLNNLATAWDVVRLADRPNGGLLIDNWHLHRSGGTLEDLHMVDPARIFGVQLSDGLIASQRSAQSGAFERLLPGEGELDVVGFVRTLDEMGVEAPYEAEPINTRWDAVPASESLPLVHRAMVDVISAARGV